MKTLGLTVLVLLGAGCSKPLPTGAACREATECGKGADCYHAICTPLCADDTECSGELVCARHHCLLATGEPWTPRDKPVIAAQERPGTQPKAPAVANTATDTPPRPAPATNNAPPPPLTPGTPRPGTRGQVIIGPPPGASPGGEDIQRLQAEIDQLKTEQARLAAELERLKNRQSE